MDPTACMQHIEELEHRGQYHDALLAMADLIAWVYGKGGFLPMGFYNDATGFAIWIDTTFRRIVVRMRFGPQEHR